MTENKRWLGSGGDTDRHGIEEIQSVAPVGWPPASSRHGIVLLLLVHVGGHLPDLSGEGSKSKGGEGRGEGRKSKGGRKRKGEEEEEEGGEAATKSLLPYVPTRGGGG